jgi:hypothetical protein
MKLQLYKKINGINFSKQLLSGTIIWIYITAKATLKYGSDTWIVNERNTERLEMAQMRFVHAYKVLQD